jgi:ribonucleoside-triphosphate reductase
MPDIESTKKLVKKIATNYKMPYYTLSPTFSICPVHGYLSGEHEFCPKCDEENGVSVDKTDVSANNKNSNVIKS